MAENTQDQQQAIIEAALMIAGHPLTVSSLQKLFAEDEQPSNADIKALLNAIREKHANGGIELHETASGYRLQAKAELSPWLSKLWEERPARYSRAFLETLAIIAYKQPITRAEIEEIRGVTVSSNITKTLIEREWVRVVGHREVPGRPAVLGTTKEFLDYFNLKSLSELPSLAEFKDLATQDHDLQVQLALENSDIGVIDSEVIPEEREAITQEDEDQLDELSAKRDAHAQEESAEQEEEALAINE